MEASSTVGDFAARFCGSLAATSATAGIAAGILGGWLTGHWLWGPFCGLLALVAIVAGAEALKARREAGDKTSSLNAPSTRGGSYNALSVSGDTYYFSDNASAGNITIAGGNIDDHRASTTVYRNHTTTVKISGLALVAFLALGGAAGGTVYIARQPGSTGAGTPASLAAEGGHSSPESAVKGFFGDALLNNWPGACSYQLPNEQSMCNFGISMGTAPQETGSIVTGNAIFDGALALVPITGRICKYSECRTFRGNGIPLGTSFQSAYAQAMNPANTTANLVPCEEVSNEWYVIAPGA